YIRQKPNKKFFFLFRLQMGLYQIGTRGKDSSKFRKWLRGIGEEPILLDTMLTHRSTNQLHILMNKKGYFNAFVTDTIIFRKKKAEVIYSIRSDVPYKINRIECTSDDTAIYWRLIEQQRHSLVQAGMNYDEDILDLERDRFTTEMKALGYYFFTKQFITYTADTSLSSHSVNIAMHVDRLNEQSTSPSGIPLAENHHQYHLNRIFVQTDYEPMSTASVRLDTTAYKNYFFLYEGDTAAKRFRRDFLLSKIFISKGDMFNINDVKNTYSRLTDLGVFRFVNVKFEEVPRDSIQQNYLLDVSILLSPLPEQDFTVETEGTYNAGNRGVAINLVYRNKNIFKGAEQLELKVKGGAELQKTFSEDKNKYVFIFNTFEIGPELNLNLKKLILLNNILRQAERKWNPRTRISLSANYQERPDYTRSITSFLFSELLKTTPYHRWTFDWFDWSAVKVSLSPEFENKLNLINDQGLTYSYNDHLITSSRLSWLYSNREKPGKMNFDYLQANLECSYELGYRVFGLDFAQNVKGDFDYRHYQNFAAGNVLVHRLYIGAGVPYSKSISLPFEKSFYGGGANDVRAWQFRTLGPGSYSNPVDIEQTGEFKIEGNVELRSVLMKYVEGAAFVDAGNIWLLKGDDQRLGGEFNTDRFLSEMALGGGIGIRFNFTYFILRLDGAVKLRDPARAESERWVYGTQKFSAKDVNYNIGIGYPF
ncbi:MAG TPA: BamA/TamA family outer membrane protein, partial [Bacteroidia bacterium]|nr:BamA/TamA family outer membrane protein [Bacteroidia bacterium]